MISSLIYLLPCLLSQTQIMEGTLLFVENGSRAVRLYTGEPESHVAIILTDKSGQWCVFEQVQPKCQKVPLNFYNSSKTWTLRFISPKVPYSQGEIRQMRDFCESRLGEPFYWRGYFEKVDNPGEHCSEFVVNALISSGKYNLRSFNLDLSNHAQPGMVKKSLLERDYFNVTK